MRNLEVQVKSLDLQKFMKYKVNFFLKFIQSSKQNVMMNPLEFSVKLILKLIHEVNVNIARLPI